MITLQDIVKLNRIYINDTWSTSQDYEIESIYLQGIDFVVKYIDKSWGEPRVREIAIAAEQMETAITNDWGATIKAVEIDHCIVKTRVKLYTDK